jgi:DNA-binding MarR family transcriptional regulator
MRPKIIHDEKLMEMIKMQKEIAAFFKVSPASVCKRLKRLKPPPDLSALTDKQRDFVVEVARGKNPAETALEVYDCKDKNSAKVLANTMMNDEGLITHIAKLMEHNGLSRTYRVNGT